MGAVQTRLSEIMTSDSATEAWCADTSLPCELLGKNPHTGRSNIILPPYSPPAGMQLVPNDCDFETRAHLYAHFEDNTAESSSMGSVGSYCLFLFEV